MSVKNRKIITICLVIIFLLLSEEVRSADDPWETFPIGMWGVHKAWFRDAADSCGSEIVIRWAWSQQDTPLEEVLDSCSQAGLRLFPWVRYFWYYKCSKAEYQEYQSEDNAYLSHDDWFEIYEHGNPPIRGIYAQDTDSAGWMQYSLNWSKYNHKLRDDTQYHLFFYMRTNNNSGNDTIAVLDAMLIDKVTNDSTIMDSLFVCASSFDSINVYEEFELSFTVDSTEATNLNKEKAAMDFRVRWIGESQNSEIWLDKTVFTDSLFMSLREGNYNDTIRAEAGKYANDTILFMWYTEDEPVRDQLDAFEIVDSLIRSETPHKTASTAICYSDLYNEFMDRGANVLLVDPYPLTKDMDSSNIEVQQAFERLTSRLREAQQASDAKGKLFWHIVQAFGTSPYGGGFRTPRPNEIKAMAYLGLAYGAKGVFYYQYNSSTDECDGLIDTTGNKTDNWYAVQELNEEFKTLRPVLKALEFVDAFPSDSITAHPSYITGISSAEFPSGEEYIEIGIFQDDFLSDYFMLVNRRCDTADAQTVTVQTTKTDGQYMIEDMLTGEKYATSDGTFRKIFLPPGDGRLFELRELFVGDEHWGGTVHMSDTIHVPSNRSLILDPGTVVRFAHLASLIADGKLVAIGTQSDSITLTADTDDPYPGYWRGVTLNFTDSLSYCDVAYGYFGVHAFGEAKSSGSLIQNCKIHHNQTYGIDCRDGSTIADNLITANNSAGIYCSGSCASPVIRRNTITGTNPIAIKCSNSANPDIGTVADGDPGNNFIEADQWRLYNETPDTIVAEGNWWGAVGDLIDSLIYDDDECDSCGPVDFDPCLREFIRADANNDEKVTIADAAYIIAYIYRGSPPPSCMDAGDANDDGRVTSADATYIAQFFSGGPPPPAPYPVCGLDLTADAPACDSHLCNDPYPLAGEDSKFGGVLSLGKFILSGDELVVPVHLANVETLSAFAWKVEYDPALISSKAVDNKGLITEGFHFFAACRNDEEGWVRTGAIMDSILARNLPPGNYQIANMVFEVNRDDVSLERLVSLTDGELVYLYKSYTVEIGDHEGSGAMSGGSPAFLTRKFSLLQNRPNPFSLETEISYSIPTRSRVELRVYDGSGRLVKILVNEEQQPGYYRVEWDGRNQTGMRVASGTYFLGLEAGDYAATRKVCVVR